MIDGLFKTTTIDSNWSGEILTECIRIGRDYIYFFFIWDYISPITGMSIVPPLPVSV